jgi:hypothetical protein
VTKDEQAIKGCQQAQEIKQGLFHTLCTCGADNLRNTQAYPIKLRRSLFLETADYIAALVPLVGIEQHERGTLVSSYAM